MRTHTTATERDYEAFKQMLTAASAAVPPEYIQMPVYGQEELIYRERVFCYELYHQLRHRWGDFPYTLAGEVDKTGHPVVRTKKKPDFLVHQPGGLGANLVAMEVKPNNARTPGIKKDLETLTWFVREADYAHGLLLVYGFDNARFERMWQTIKELGDNYDTIDLGRLDIICWQRRPINAADGGGTAAGLFEGVEEKLGD